MNQNRDVDRLSIRVAEFVVGGWFCDKIGGFYCVAKLMEEEEETRKWVAHQVITLLLTDLQTDYKQVHFTGNFLCINNMSLHLLIFFNSLFFHCNSLSRYWVNIFIFIQRWTQWETNISVKLTIIYRQKVCVGIFVLIC